jgi:hypothetical protein
MLASGKHGIVGFGVTVRYEISSDRSERSGVSLTDLFTFPVYPIQQPLPIYAAIVRLQPPVAVLARQ